MDGELGRNGNANKFTNMSKNMSTRIPWQVNKDTNLFSLDTLHLFFSTDTTTNVFNLMVEME